MSLTFRRTMDPDSLDIRRDEKAIGYLQKHKEKQPRIVLRETLEHLTLSELQSCLARLTEFLQEKSC